MAFSDVLGRALAQRAGTTPVTAENFSQQALGQMVESVRSDRPGLQRLRDQSRVASGNLVNRMRRRQGASISSAVAQGGAGAPASFGGALSDALRRTKMRTRMSAQGEGAIEQQGLRDRIAIAQASREREGALINAEAAARNIREGVNVGVADANAAIRASRAGSFGTAAGALTGVLSNKEGREGLTKAIKGIGSFIGGG